MFCWLIPPFFWTARKAQLFDWTEYNCFTIWIISYFWCIPINNSRHTYIIYHYFIPDYFTNQTTQFITFSDEWSLFHSKTWYNWFHIFLWYLFHHKSNSYLSSHFFLHLGFSYFTRSTWCNHSQFWNHKIYVGTKVRDRQQIFFLHLFWETLLSRYGALIIHEFYLSLAYELPYSIGIIQPPRIWMKALSVLDFWTHLMEHSKSELALLLACSQSRVFDCSQQIKWCYTMSCV